MVKCIVCGHSTLSEMIAFEKYPLCIGVLPPELLGKVGSFPLLIGRCGQCGHVQQMNPIADHHNDVIYGDKAAGLLSTVLMPSQTEVGRVEAQNSFNFFEGCRLPKGKVLDIGCCDGYFLSLLKAQGYEVRGIEPNPVGRIAEEKYGIPITKEYFSEKFFEKESFDIILLRNILEHMSDVNDFLDKVVKVLKPGGHIFIEVPNSARSFEEGQIGCFFHQHLSYFSLGALLFLLSKHSLEHVSSLEDYFLYLCVKKTSRSRGEKLSLQERPKSINKNTENYFKKYNQKKQDLASLLEKENKVAILGAGGHTTGLVHMLDKKFREKIKFVYDNNPLKHENLLAEIPIVVRDPKHIKSDNPDMIIISSYLHQAALLDQVKRMEIPGLKVVTIHPQVKIAVGKERITSNV